MNVVFGRLKSASVAGIIAIAGILILAGACSREREDTGEGGNREISIIYSSDLLGRIRSCGCAADDMGGVGRMATFIQEAGAGNPNLLVLDAGDNFTLDLSFSRKEARLAMEAFDIAGVDVITPGELDFVFGLPFLLEMFSEKEFGVVSANIVDPATNEPIFGSSYRVISMPNGLKVGVTGVLDEEVEFPGYVDRSNFSVLPAQPSLISIIPEMKKRADFLILLSHTGLEGSKELVRNIGDFDLVIAGHNKPLAKDAIKVGDTMILATGGQGQYIGQVDIEITPGGKIGSSRMKLVGLVDEIALHPEVKRLFRKYGLAFSDKEKEGKI